MSSEDSGASVGHPLWPLRREAARALDRAGGADAAKFGGGVGRPDATGASVAVSGGAAVSRSASAAAARGPGQPRCASIPAAEQLSALHLRRPASLLSRPGNRRARHQYGAGLDLEKRAGEPATTGADSRAFR